MKKKKRIVFALSVVVIAIGATPATGGAPISQEFRARGTTAGTVRLFQVGLNASGWPAAALTSCLADSNPTAACSAVSCIAGTTAILCGVAKPTTASHARPHSAYAAVEILNWFSSVSSGVVVWILTKLFGWKTPCDTGYAKTLCGAPFEGTVRNHRDVTVDVKRGFFPVSPRWTKDATLFFTTKNGVPAGEGKLALNDAGTEYKTIILDKTLKELTKRAR